MLHNAKDAKCLLLLKANKKGILSAGGTSRVGGGGAGSVVYTALSIKQIKII